jgi:hypothetical protein
MSRAARLAALLLPLAACGGGESREEVVNVLVSPEKQQADLRRAYDLGIISREEYLREVSEIGRP